MGIILFIFSIIITIIWYKVFRSFIFVCKELQFVQKRVNITSDNSISEGDYDSSFIDSAMYLSMYNE